jgi:hypothetical protein
MFSEKAYRDGVADTLALLAEACQQRGAFEEAASHAEEALRLFRQSGHRIGQADALNRIGEILRAELAAAATGDASGSR